MKALTIQKIYKAYIIPLLFILPIGCYRAIAQDNGEVSLRGTIKGLKDGDSVKLIRYQYPFLLPSRENEIVSYALVKNNSFIFNTPLRHQLESCRLIFPEYMTSLNWENGILEKGQHLNIKLKEGRLSFTGLGADLLDYDHRIDSICNSISGIDRTGKDMDKNFKIITIAISKIHNTEKYALTNDDAFTILRYEGILGLLGSLYSIASRNDLNAKAFMQKNDDLIYDAYIEDILNNSNITSLPRSSINGFIRARFDCLYPKSQHETKLQRDKAYISYLKANFKNPVLSQMLASFLYDNKNTDLLTGDYIEWILKEADFSQYNSLLNSIRRFSPGTTFPEFALTDTLGNEVLLSQFKGNVLVLDFWYTGCLACARTYKIMKPTIKEFEGKPVKFISISEDKIRSVWVKSIYSGVYTDPKHINLSAGKQGNNHPLFRYLQIIGYPTIIVIDKYGKIIGSPRKPALDQGKDLKNKIQLQLSENSQESLK